VPMRLVVLGRALCFTGLVMLVLLMFVVTLKLFSASASFSGDGEGDLVRNLEGRSVESEVFLGLECIILR